MRFLKKAKYVRLCYFFDFFLEGNDFPSFYRKITEVLSKKVVYTSQNKEVPEFENKAYSIYDMPDYFKTEIESKDSSISILDIPLYTGYLINLNSYKDFEDYMDTKVRKARCSQLRRYRKRLDLCIRPVYKIYYGQIEKEEYNRLFNTLLKMTERRFIQKKERNFELPFLETYRATMYPLILEKKASIFVIYDGEKPINISLNFIDEHIIFHWNSCYDIDYCMFNLGHINMVNHVKWAYENNFKLFDMGRGDFFHKRKWVDQTYIYEEQLIYDSKSLHAMILVYVRLAFLKLRYSVIQVLKKLKFHLWYGKFIKYRYRNSHEFKNLVRKEEVRIIDDNFKMPSINKLKRIPIDNIQDSFIINSINYFIHKNQEYVQEIEVYLELKNPSCYYLKSNKRIQKVLITSI
ncbi:GNAT family N-acetyltransferase [Flagellimonas sp. 389]|uniref:GNAT family N-acetyltransferase n=1 Tax=Flagellimonas sp. 389 TaxID=2835862 RepID=UPI001BD3B7C5|nr:GNAT family N-acetyltransferase [Flagellimonas sp. 389]MBS9463884.1 GNAT family N-acetyltransferase [Flagellimonas sp. 389]